MITTGGCKVYRETVTVHQVCKHLEINANSHANFCCTHLCSMCSFTDNLMNVVFIFSVMSHRFAFDFLTCRIYIYIIIKKNST